MRASLRIDQGKRFSTINALIAGCILGLWLTSVAHGQEQYTDLFQEVLDTLNNNFYDSALILESIPKFEDRYGAQVQQIGSHEEFAALVNEMLGELNASHTNYLTPRDFEYYQLAAIFQGIPRIGALFEEGHVLYPSIGIIPLEREGSTFVASVLAGSEAERAGLQMGDEILAADGRPFSIISSFRESVGEEVVLQIRREKEAPPLLVSVVPELVNPKEEMLNAEKASIRLIEKDDHQIGYLHIWSYAGSEYHDVLVNAISWGILKEAEALIIDLRFGLGGASPSYLNIFHQQVPNMAMINRNGEEVGINLQWRKPAAYLVNGYSTSGKELLAYGAKKYNLAYVTGSRTAGSVLGGQLIALSNNDVLYLAVMDIKVDGERLEGVGVLPDHEIQMSIPYLQGNDIQLEGTVDFLLEKLDPTR